MWSLTWEEYYAREERYQEEQQRWDERFGLMPSIYTSVHSKEGEKPKHPGFFFGYAEPKKAVMGPTQELTTAQQIAAWRAAFPAKPK